MEIPNTCVCIENDKMLETNRISSRYLLLVIIYVLAERRANGSSDAKIAANHWENTSRVPTQVSTPLPLDCLNKKNDYFSLHKHRS